MRFLFIVLIILTNVALLTSAEVIFSATEGHIFDNIEDEYYLVNYFLSNNEKKYYKKLNNEDKMDYILSFWEANDPNPATSKNELLNQLKQRIIYSNEQFTHFMHGWKSDRGRIYIRYGEPFEILKKRTKDTSKYPHKEYQIWKYRITSYRTYIFLDIQQHGNYRLIFSDGDPKESSWADWKNYIGQSFDEGVLY